MLVTDDGISTLVNPLQPENAEEPMLVTDDGISTLVNPLQPENAEEPMLVRPVVWDKSRWILADSPAAVSVASKVLMVEEVITPVTTTLYSPQPENA